MISDKQLMLDEANAITVTRNSTNVIDLSRAGENVGVGEEITIRVSVDTAFTAGGAATLNIALVTDDNPELTTPTAIEDCAVVVPVADLIVGFEKVFRVLPSVLERYLGLVYTVATGPMTAGKITAGTVESMQKSKTYSKNYVAA